MKTIKIRPPTSEGFFDHFLYLYRILRDVDDRVLFDFREAKWFFPVVLLPLATYINDTDSKFFPPADERLLEYFDTVAFPKGVEHAFEIKDERSYIPIAHIKKRNPKERAKIEEKFIETLYHVLNPTVEIRNAIYYPISEFVDNIFQHSKRDEGYLFAQYYPTKKFLDMCIVDRGVGLVGSYKKVLNLKLSDEEAIKEALEGRSTKNSNERGYGIATSERIICEALKGEFLLISGKAAFYSSPHQGGIIYTLPKFDWNGVIVAYRIPKPQNYVDIYQYVEG